jgi:hypothetical protein
MKNSFLETREKEYVSTEARIWIEEVGVGMCRNSTVIRSIISVKWGTRLFHYSKNSKIRLNNIIRGKANIMLRETVLRPAGNLPSL